MIDGVAGTVHFKHEVSKLRIAGEEVVAFGMVDKCASVTFIGQYQIEEGERGHVAIFLCKRAVQSD